MILFRNSFVEWEMEDIPRIERQGHSNSFRFSDAHMLNAGSVVKKHLISKAWQSYCSVHSVWLSL